MLNLRRMTGAIALVLAATVAAPVMTGLPLVTPAAAASPHRAPLTAQDHADIQAAQSYLNAITSLKARFLQMASNGAQSEGTCFVSRPGKLRLQYDPPSPLLVVADGTFLIVQDKTVDNPSYIPLGSTPAGILVRSNVELNSGDLTVTRVNRQAGVVSVTVAQSDDSGQGELTLVFSERPYQLRQWRVVDAQGQMTTVSLFDVQTGLPLDGKLFEYKDPNFGRPKL